MASTFNSIRRAVFGFGIVAGSFAFVAGGATAAHAEMDPWETPTQADVDWVPGTGWSGTTGGQSGWWVGDYYLDSWNWLGTDIWTKNNGFQASNDDALGLKQHYGYSSCAPGASGEIYCRLF